MSAASSRIHTFSSLPTRNPLDTLTHLLPLRTILSLESLLQWMHEANSQIRPHFYAEASTTSTDVLCVCCGHMHAIETFVNEGFRGVREVLELANGDGKEGLKDRGEVVQKWLDIWGERRPWTKTRGGDGPEYWSDVASRSLSLFKVEPMPTTTLPTSNWVSGDASNVATQASKLRATVVVEKIDRLLAFTLKELEHIAIYYVEMAGVLEGYLGWEERRNVLWKSVFDDFEKMEGMFGMEMGEVRKSMSECPRMVGREVVPIVESQTQESGMAEIAEKNELLLSIEELRLRSLSRDI